VRLLKGLKLALFIFENENKLINFRYYPILNCNGYPKLSSNIERLNFERVDTNEMVYLFYFYIIVLGGYIFWVRPCTICRWFYAGESHDFFGGCTHIFDSNRSPTILEKEKKKTINKLKINCKNKPFSVKLHK
jgi:hypothetical protein